MNTPAIISITITVAAIALTVWNVRRARTSEARALDQWRARHLAESDARIAAMERKA